jgi:hypothetical protein
MPATPGSQFLQSPARLPPIGRALPRKQNDHHGHGFGKMKCFLGAVPKLLARKESVYGYPEQKYILPTNRDKTLVSKLAYAYWLMDEIKLACPRVLTLSPV